MPPFAIKDVQGKTHRLTLEQVRQLMQAGNLPAQAMLVDEATGHKMSAGSLAAAPAASAAAPAPAQAAATQAAPSEEQRRYLQRAAARKQSSRKVWFSAAAVLLAVGAAGGAGYLLIGGKPGTKTGAQAAAPTTGKTGGTAPTGPGDSAKVAAAKPGEPAPASAIAAPAAPAEPFKVVASVNDLPVWDWTRMPAEFAPSQDAWVKQVLGGQSDQAMAQLRGELEAALKPGGADPTRATLTASAADPRTRLLLMRHEFMRLAGPEAFDTIARRPDGERFLSALLTRADWMEDFLTTGTFDAGRKTANDLHNWCTLFRFDKRSVLPQYRKLAIAYARNQEGNWDDDTRAFSLLDAWQAHVGLHAAGRMHASFDKLEAWEMMYVTMCDGGGNRDGDRRHILDLGYGRACPQPQYDGACWEIPWVGDNEFGDSCQSDTYYSMWRNQYVRGAPSIKKVWGVCGTLSTYGSNSARAHGIPSFPVGQPGHCAYMIRDDDENWSTPYSVTWPTDAGSFFGRGDESIVRLMQGAYSNKRRARLLRAHAHLWQRAFLQRAGEVALDAGTLRIYENGRGGSLRALERMTPVSTAPSRDTDLLGALDGRGGWRAATLDAPFTLAEARSLHAVLASDDGSRLFIDGRCVIDNDGSHGDITKEADLELAAGTHQLRLEYFDGGGGATFRFSMKPKGPAPVGADLALDLALEACPLHYNAWKDKADALAARNAGADEWRAYAAAMVAALADYAHPALTLLEQKCLPALKDKLNPAERLAFAKDSLQRLPVNGRDGAGGFMPRHLDQMADFLGDPAAEVALFDAALGHFAKDRGLSHVQAWGSTRLASQPKIADAYLKVVLDHLRGSSNGDVTAALADMLVAAEKRADIRAFKTVSAMVPQLLPDADPVALRHFSRGDAGRFPATKPYPGKLLSADGVVTLSSLFDPKTCLTHAAALGNDPMGGFIHTEREENTQVTLTLPGKAKITGVVLVNRYEGMGERNVPFRLLASGDGKDWTEVFATDQNLPAYQIDLAKSAPQAQYLRMERTGPRKDFINLRAFRVYGTPLY